MNDPADAAAGAEPLSLGALVAELDADPSAETVLRIAPLIARHDPSHTVALLDHPPAGVARGELGAAVAPAAPDVVLEHAARWFGTEDIEVVLRLPRHWHRVAVAGALGPWPEAAHARVDDAALREDWPDRDTAALHRAMTGTDPALNRPPGIDDGRRWWIVAGEPWAWTLWRAEDGTLAREVLEPGPAYTSSTRLLTAEETAIIAEEGVAAGSRFP